MSHKLNHPQKQYNHNLSTKPKYKQNTTINTKGVGLTPPQLRKHLSSDAHDKISKMTIKERQRGR